MGRRRRGSQLGALQLEQCHGFSQLRRVGGLQDEALEGLSLRLLLLLLLLLLGDL